MLTAEPVELSGSTGSGLALHIATCASCRTQAALLLEAGSELARALDAAAGHDAVGAVRSALAAARRRRDAAQRRAWTIPLAAAALLAGLLVIRYSGSSPAQPSAPAARPDAGRGITVAAPRGRNVAVLQTDNPNVVVIWFF